MPVLSPGPRMYVPDVEIEIDDVMRRRACSATRRCTRVGAVKRLDERRRLSLP